MCSVILYILPHFLFGSYRCKHRGKVRIYCYVDETGQDLRADFFIVVAVVSDEKQNPLRSRLEKLEALVKIGKKKWKEVKRSKKYLKRSQKYLKLALKEKIAI